MGATQTTFSGSQTTFTNGPTTFVQSNTTPRPRPIQTTFIQQPIETTFIQPINTTPRPRPAQTTPAILTTTGYDYPVPEVTLPVRPNQPAVVTTIQSEVSQPSVLYGAPLRNGRRFGRRGRRLRRRKIQRKRNLDYSTKL